MPSQLSYYFVANLQQSATSSAHFAAAQTKPYQLAAYTNAITYNWEIISLARPKACNGKWYLLYIYVNRFILIAWWVCMLCASLDPHILRTDNGNERNSNKMYTVRGFWSMIKWIFQLKATRLKRCVNDFLMVRLRGTLWTDLLPICRL